jgi:hypothetical protein
MQPLSFYSLCASWLCCVSVATNNFILLLACAALIARSSEHQIEILIEAGGALGDLLTTMSAMGSVH